MAKVTITLNEQDLEQAAIAHAQQIMSGYSVSEVGEIKWRNRELSVTLVEATQAEIPHVEQIGDSKPEPERVDIGTDEF